MHMLRILNDVKDCVLNARDGEIGRIDAFLFDDQDWTVRYLAVTTGEWLSHATVLISPISVKAIDVNRHTVLLSVVRDQVMNGPRFDRARPLTRPAEMEFYRHYGWPLYWKGPELWGASSYPTDINIPPLDGRPPGDKLPATLRSTAGVAGFEVKATDGLLGYVDDYIIDDDTWALRYVIVSTRQWLPGNRVLFPPMWMTEINWERRYMVIPHDTQKVHDAPEYDYFSAITRAYEATLHHYYGKEEHQPALSFSAAR